MVVKHFDNQNPRFATVKSSLGVSFSCLFGELQGKRLFVDAQGSIPSSTAVTVEYDDNLFLGEVIACRDSVEHFSLEIKVEQVLNGLQSLMALRSRLLCEAPVTATTANSPFAGVFAAR